MYDNIAQNYISNMYALREYANSVDNFVNKKEEFNSDEALIATIMWIAKDFKERGVNIDEFDFMKMMPNNVEATDEIALKTTNILKSLVKQMSKKLVVTGDGKNATYVHMSKDIKKEFVRVEAENKKVDILYSGSLMLLVTYFENLISKVMKEDIRLHPERVSLEMKQVPFSMLEKADNLSDIKDMLIEEEVTSLMYKSLESWLDYFGKKVKLKQDYIKKVQGKLEEIIARRNLIVHNEGKVNSIYLNVVKEEERKNIKRGDVLEVDREYLYNAIDIIELSGISLIIEMWIKEYGDNEKELDKITNLIFSDYLIFDKWEEAKTLYEICLNSKKLREADKLVCQINRWQCYKWQGRFEEVESEIKKWDISASSPQFKLAKLALLDKYEEFFKTFDEQSEVIEEFLREWPLFRNIRESQIYKERYIAK